MFAISSPTMWLGTNVSVRRKLPPSTMPRLRATTSSTTGCITASRWCTSMCSIPESCTIVQSCRSKGSAFLNDGICQPHTSARIQADVLQNVRVNSDTPECVTCISRSWGIGIIGSQGPRHLLCIQEPRRATHDVSAGRRRGLGSQEGPAGALEIPSGIPGEGFHEAILGVDELQHVLHDHARGPHEGRSDRQNGQYKRCRLVFTRCDFRQW